MRRPPLTRAVPSPTHAPEAIHPVFRPCAHLLDISSGLDFDLYISFRRTLRLARLGQSPPRL